MLKLEGSGINAASSDNGANGDTAGAGASANGSSAADGGPGADNESGTSAAQGKAFPGKPAGGGSSLTMNQTLDGHSGAIMVAAWNEHYRKLTTSDERGLIIVWTLHKGTWYEEMINNRNKSVVRDMRWNADGTRICIVYEDGAVIVGSVDGNRLWGKDLDLELSFVEWSPNSRVILFCTSGGDCHTYDNSGNPIAQMRIVAADGLLDSGSGSNGRRIVSLEWYKGTSATSQSDGKASSSDDSGIGGEAGAGMGSSKALDTSASSSAQPTLAIAFEAGKVQLMRSETDPNPIIIDVGHRVTKVSWSPDGSVLAVAGTIDAPPSSEMTTSSNVVDFFTPLGTHMRSLRVPGSCINAVTWEGDGLRIALAVDSFIYFANIRIRYSWSFFNNTLVYAYRKPERTDDCVMFWDTRFGEKYAKYVKNLVGIASAGEHCALVTRAEEPDAKSFIVILCNAIGSPVDSRYISIVPTHICVTEKMVLVADGEYVYRWIFSSVTAGLSASSSSMSSMGGGTSSLVSQMSRESVFHIDELHVTKVNGYSSMLEATTMPQPLAGKAFGSRGAKNPIVAACVSSDGAMLVVAREDNSVARYRMGEDSVMLEETASTRSSVQQIALNCDSSRLGVVDVAGTLTQIALGNCTKSKAHAGGGGALRSRDHGSSLAATSAGSSSGDGVSNVNSEVGRFERRDCWDFKWSLDDPQLLASMEKGRMYIYRGGNPEEHVQISGYLCEFHDLEVLSVALDVIMRNPLHPDRTSMFNLETKSLRDTREMLGRISTEDAYEFIEGHSHPRLWRLLAEHALQRLDLPLVDKAFVRCGDYHGIQLAKKLSGMGDRYAQQAEVAAYFKNFEEAESIYRSMDRMDLAIAMRIRLGDWFKVEKLVQQGHGDDSLLHLAWNKIGEYYADRRKWIKAVQYFAQARNTEMLVNCFYALEDYNGLEKLIGTLPEGSALLTDIGEKFLSVGLCTEAVSAYMKAGDVAAAVQGCITLSQWDVAVSLAHRSGDPKLMESTHAAYKEAVQSQVKPMQAVALYRKTGMHTEAAQLLIDIACKAAKRREAPMRIKKIFVLAALEVESFRKSVLSADETGGMGGGVGIAASMPFSSMPSSGLDSTGPGGADTSIPVGGGVSLNGLMALSTSGDDNLAMQSPWRGAEIVHFWILAHRLLYDGKFLDAMETASLIAEAKLQQPGSSVSGIVDDEELQAFIALAAFYSRKFGACSRALMKLESMPDLSNDHRGEYANTAVEIFTRHPATDETASSGGLSSRDRRKSLSKVERARELLNQPIPSLEDAKGGSNNGSELSGSGRSIGLACVLSGKIPTSSDAVTTCTRCKHRMLTALLRTYKNTKRTGQHSSSVDNGRADGNSRVCPLCHNALSAETSAPSGNNAAASGVGGMSRRRDSIEARRRSVLAA